MEHLFTAFKFVVGGGMVVGITWLARYVDPKYGGILVAAPIITTIAFLFTYTESGFQVTQQLAMASFSFMVPTILFVLALYLLMFRFSFGPALIGAYTIWIAGIFILNGILGRWDETWPVSTDTLKSLIQGAQLHVP
jgi:uncharacterized membrane protein (GlpM family)